MDADDLSPQKSPRLADNQTPAQPDYRPAWREYRRREWWFLGGSLGGFVAIVAVGALARLLGLPAVARLTIPVLGAVWILGFVVLGSRVRFFPCPRCHRPFFFRFFYWSLFDRTCRHCGLPLWATTNVRTPGRLFAWLPPDDDLAAGSTERFGEGIRPRDGCVTTRWRLIVGEACRITALSLGVIAIVEAAACTRWLLIDWRSGGEARPLAWGIALTLGQALLLGAVVEVVFAMLLWLAAGSIQRPKRPTPG
jgi:hypothetical protein